MNTSEDISVGRCLRSGLKPNFKSEPNSTNGPKDKSKFVDKKGSSVRVKIHKSVIKDKKLFLNQTIKLVRLRAHVIRKYDKTFYKKYSKQIKAEKNLNKYSKIRQILVKNQKDLKPIQSAIQSNDSPKRMVLWTSPNPQIKQQISYPILRSHVKRLAKCDDRENSLISLPEFCRNLDLISFNDLSRMNTKQMKTSFSIRHISKTEDYSINNKNQIEINYEDLIGTIDQNENSNQLIQNNHKKKNKKRSEWTANKVKQKYNKLEKQKRKVAELWKKQYINCLSMFDMSSPLGQRVFTSLRTQKLETRKMESYVKHYELFCGTRIRFKSKIENEYNKWKVRRIERLTTGQELSSKNRCFTCHQYSFNRRQRLEKMLRIKSGIDWKSRLLALHCRQQLELHIKKLKFCPFCKEDIEDNHSCDINASERESIYASSEGSSRKSSIISTDSQRVLRSQKGKQEIDLMQNETQVSHKKKKKSFLKSPRIVFIDLDSKYD